jgi:hypothetical protein
MSIAREKFLSQILDLIEQRESRLLTWGIVDGFFSHGELHGLIDQALESALEQGFEDFLAADEVLTVLLDRKWITNVELNDGASGYRSRMAETVRLLQRLRQLFPKHAGAAGWQHAPTLVADFRFLRRRREYPRREITADSAINQLREVTSSAAMLSAAKALLSSSGRKFMLSGFQLRAAQRIIRGIESDVPLATIVCAGTGSGKTLAFYLPALASIVRHLIAETNGKPWVKAVAIYPRTELLKDQLREVLSRAQAITNELPSSTRVTIRVGALFGDTPASAQYCKWPKIGNDYICTSLACLKCGGELRWRHADRSVGQERLFCSSCDFQLDGEVFPLTREAIKKRPPDILFTTTEMLNQRMADNSMCHLFGIGPKAVRAPELVLLDEVHTYEGRHGAQVAYLMRRWQRQIEQPLRFVGLSATLREAREFFASLTGCRQNLVDEVSPQSNEIEAEGAEYLIALRGDPVSRAALLSTTIQTTMLLQRCLDPKTPKAAGSLSHGAFGQKSFIFTDNLDVINRLYFDLLSAEGRTSFGVPDTRNAPNGGLALLRATGTSHFRYVNGQDWRFCESLHGSLKNRLVVKRVSSQDRGVDAAADVIVATAVLEVGFDDPTVGAVVQHKAPRGMASFLQRKGRAGRTRGMRPWTAVVLSDYGRDRFSYQSYDLLFDPELPVRTLPLSNRYLTRMQAVYATIDYLGARLQDGPLGSVWNDLSGPSNNEVRRSRLRKELQSILESENATKRLADYLQRALRLPSEEISALLWEYPRPLMTTVLPTALRRLTTKWSADGQVNMDYAVVNNPLPDFIPATLFAELNLAEVEIKLPNVSEEKGLDRNVMSVFAALREFAPGRVSRRYGVRSKTERHWLPPSPEMQASGSFAGGTASLDVMSIGTHVLVGEFLIGRSESIVSIPVYRPVAITPIAPPKNVKDSSNASLQWRSQFVASVEPTWLLPPDRGVWRELVAKVGFFTHARHAPIEVRRFAIGATSEVGVGQEKVRIETGFTVDDTPVALGTNFFADAVLFQIQIPSDLYVRDGAGTDKKWRALRTTRFLDAAWRGHSLAMVSSPFMREWLAQIFLSAVTFEAMQDNQSVEEAARSLATGTATVTLAKVLHLLFQSNVVEAQTGEGDELPQEKLRQELEECLQRVEVVDELHRAACVLWEKITDTWRPWLTSVYHSTFASAFLRSITDLCPTIDPEDLNVDLGRGPVDDGQAAAFDPALSEVWLTEKSPGGSGLVEEFMRRYSEDPRRFFSVVRANLEMSEFELIDYQLNGLVHVLSNGSESEVTGCVEKFRAAQNQEDMTKHLRVLRRALVNEGFSPFHGFFVSMGNRILRQGSGPATDRYLAKVLERWESEEARLGVEIDLRVMSYALSQSNEIDQVIMEFSAAIGTDRGAWRMSAIYGLLWARGRAIRQTALQVRNPFCELPPIERLLVAESIVDDRVRISVEENDWLERTAEQLAAGRLVTLMCHESKRELLGNALNALVTNPIDAGYLRAYARLQGVRQSTSAIEADIELIEAVQ